MTADVPGRAALPNPPTGREDAPDAVGGPRDPRTDAAIRARLRKLLAGIVLLCLVLGAAGFAFVRWMATLPPGTLKIH